MHAIGCHAVETGACTHCWWFAHAHLAKQSVLQSMSRVVDVCLASNTFSLQSCLSLLSPSTSTDQVAIAVTALKDQYLGGLLVAHDLGEGAFLFPTSLCGVFVFSSAPDASSFSSSPPSPPPHLSHTTHLSHNSSHTTHLSHNSSHTQLISHTTHLTHNSSHTTHLTQLISHTAHLSHTRLAQLISHNSSHTTHLTQLISHTLISQNSSHTTHLSHTHLTQLISHTLISHNSSHSTHLTHNSSHTTHLTDAAGPGLLLRGRRSTSCTWTYLCVAGAALRAHGCTFAWQVQHFDSLGIAGARLDAAGHRLLLRGRRSTSCRWTYFCVVGAALRAHGRTFAWQVRHFDSLGIAGARLDAAGPRLLLRGRRSTSCTWTYLCVAGAALRAHGCTFAWHFGTLTLWGLPARAWTPLVPGCFCVAGAALRAHGPTCPWQVQHFVHMDLLLRGRCGTLTLWGLPARAWTPLVPGCFCVAGAALRAHGPTCAWQVQHFVQMDVLLRGRCGTLTLWGLLARAWTPLVPGCFCVAGAALRAHGPTFAWQVQHFVHMDVLLRGRCGIFDSLGIAGARLDAAGPRLLLRGRRSTSCTWTYFRVAGAALRAHGCTFAWQVRRFDSLGIAGARLDAAGPRLLLRGRRSTSCTWTYLCVAGAALRAHGRTFAWQVRHFDSLGIAGARLDAAGPRLLLRGRRSTSCTWTYFCVAGAALRAHGPTFAWQVRHFDSLGIAGARLDAAGPRLLLRGRRSTSCTWTYLCVAGAALRAHGCTFAWHFGTLTLWGLPARAWTPLVTGCFCVAGAALRARGRCSTSCTWTYFCVAGAGL